MRRGRDSPSPHPPLGEEVAFTFANPEEQEQVRRSAHPLPWSSGVAPNPCQQEFIRSVHASKGLKSHLVYDQHGSEPPSKPTHEPTRSSGRSYCSTFRTVPERLPKTLPGNGQERWVGDPIYPSAPTSGFQRSCHAHILMLASSKPPRSVMANRSANPSVHLPLHRCVYFCEQRRPGPGPCAPVPPARGNLRQIAS